jgi:formylglycine-generating enzyme required for sulfatase activity
VSSRLHGLGAVRDKPSGRRDSCARKEEQPFGDVELPAFDIARYPTTIAQIAAFIGNSALGNCLWPARRLDAGQHAPHLVEEPEDDRDVRERLVVGR